MNNLSEKTFELLCARWRSNDPASIRTLFQLLAKSGTPVPIDTWASESGKPVEHLENLLDDSKIEINSESAVTELFGFAVGGMPWNLAIDNIRLFACCPLIGNTVATITDRPVTLTPVTSYPGLEGPIQLGSEYVATNVKSGLKASFIDVDQEEFQTSIFNAFCSHIRFYSNDADAQAFVDEHPRRYLMEMNEFISFTEELVNAVWR